MHNPHTWVDRLGLAPGSVDRPNLFDGGGAFHTVHGDFTGGGHKWPGQPGKSVFPPDWDTDRILNSASEVATNPSSKWEWIKGVDGGDYTKKGQPSRVAAIGVVDGVEIKTIIEPVNNR